MHLPIPNIHLANCRQNFKKRDLKEKVVQIYESFFTEDQSSLVSLINNENFWNEFFLLRANPQALHDILDKLDQEDLKRCKNITNFLFAESVVMLDSDNYVRIANALTTLLTLSRRILISSQSISDSIDFLMGYNDLEVKINLFSNKLYALLISENPFPLRALVLRIYSTFLTCCEDIDTNPFVDLLMTGELFDVFISLLASPLARHWYGYDVVVLMTILVSYKNFHSEKNLGNLFAGRLSIVDNEVALNGYAQVISYSFLEFTRKFYDRKEEASSNGLFSSLASMVGNMFIAEDVSVNCNQLQPDNAVLMAFFEVVHLNRNFITQLTHTQENYLDNELNCPSTSNSNSSSRNDQYAHLPSNLLATFFEFSSIVMLQTKNEDNFDTVRLCFIILTCISEDQCANAVMHDMNIVFRVQLHRMPMRHRKVSDESFKNLRPLAYSVLDLMIEFISTHLTKNLLCELYIFAVGVIHRLICYQKKCKIRFNYSWRELWYALINLLKFLVNNESELIKKWNIIFLANYVVHIFNLFITFGDTFLPSPQAYDDLYYEIIPLRYSAMEGASFKEHGARLANNLINIKAIINHFNSKIEQWNVANQIGSLTEEQVLEVVRNNYDSLTLKLQDALDHYETYPSMKGKDSQLFSRVIKKVILKYREKRLEFTPQEQQTLMQAILIIP